MASSEIERSMPARKHAWLWALLCSIAIAIAATVWLNPVNEEEGFDESTVLERLSHIVTPDYVSSEVNKLVEKGDIELAKQYLKLASDLNIHASQAALDDVAQADSTYETTKRNVFGFADGFIHGGGDSSAAVAGGITSDFTVVGDIRDISTETTHYLNNEPVDTVIASLAAVGLAMTAGTVLSMGTASPETLPAKMGVSILKYARKTGNISAKLLSSLRKLFGEAIHLDGIFKRASAVKGWDRFSPTKWGKVIDASRSDIRLEKVNGMFDSVSSIKKSSGSISNTVKLIRYADNPAELKLLGKLSRSFGKKSYAVMKIIGKSALKITKHAIKMMVGLIAAITSLCYGLLSLFISNVFRRKVMQLIRS